MWRKFRLICPQCSYHYSVELLWEHEVEICPICGNTKPFQVFVEYEVEPPPQATTIDVTPSYQSGY